MSTDKNGDKRWNGSGIISSPTGSPVLPLNKEALNNGDIVYGWLNASGAQTPYQKCYGCWPRVDDASLSEKNFEKTIGRWCNQGDLSYKGQYRDYTSYNNGTIGNASAVLDLCNSNASCGGVTFQCNKFKFVSQVIGTNTTHGNKEKDYVYTCYNKSPTGSPTKVEASPVAKVESSSVVKVEASPVAKVESSSVVKVQVSPVVKVKVNSSLSPVAKVEKSKKKNNTILYIGIVSAFVLALVVFFIIKKKRQ